MLFDLGNGFVYESDQLVIYKSSCVDSVIHIPDSIDIYPRCDNLKIDLSDVKNIGFYITRNCNLRCRYCFESSIEGSIDPTHETIIFFVEEMLLKFLSNRFGSEYEDSFVISITGGGEPTYNWHLLKRVVDDIISLKKRTNLPIILRITTNGLITDTNILDYLISNFDTIMVSYDGMDEIQNNNRPLPGGFRSSTIVEQSIQYITKSKPITIRTTLFQNQLSYVREMADYLFTVMDMNNVTWDINIVYPLGRGSNVTYESDNNNFFDHYLELKNYLEENYDYHSLTTSVLSTNLIKRFCGAFVNDSPSVWLLPDNSLTNCTEYDGHERLGHIIGKSIIYNDNYTDYLSEEYYMSRETVYAKK